ncbi:MULTISPECIES: MFS transporter [Halorussus]|uniref:MFS transporter n=1 Tax=Halorussus TaxID=1070314 RepID=UPI000E218CC8|nr:MULTISPECIES: MFS transporter [Halorussus]NHN58393.1 MFS transporter [Halorussus sp. JP-T4]
MRLFGFLRERRWTPAVGYGLFVALLAAGYYYNVTFVQLGLLDLGTRLVGMTETQVSVWMAALALLTFGVAVATGVTMDRRGWSADLLVKLRLLFGVVALQTVLTAGAPAIRTVPAFGAWIVAASVALGVGIPASFGLTVDLVPVEDRGYVAAATTALAYFAANVYPLDWSIESFAAIMVAAMVPGALALGVLASGRVGPANRLLAGLADQHEEWGVGRFCRPRPVRTRSVAFWGPVALMFGVFFVDSLGFLRIVETPALVRGAWRSPDFADHLFLGVVHVLGALVAGVLYANFDRNWLFAWVFGLFSLTHLFYTTDVRVAAWFPGLASGGASPLNSAVYAVAVSFYTTLNFALWPDLSTPDTVGAHTALGVGLAGWVATFLSTAVALYFEAAEVTLLSHLNLVNALALLLFAGLVAAVYLRRLVAAAREASAG